jgi:hypothetical protein
MDPRSFDRLLGRTAGMTTLPWYLWILIVLRRFIVIQH